MYLNIVKQVKEYYLLYVFPDWNLGYFFVTTSNRFWLNEKNNLHTYPAAVADQRLWSVEIQYGYCPYFAE